MLKSYFSTSMRFFSKQRSYTLINIGGLSVGIACSLLILLWVQDELKIDHFHQKGGQLFRTMRHAYFTDGNIFTWSAVPKPLAQTLEEEYPEVLEAELITWEQQLLIARDEQAFKEKGRFAGKDFFSIFTYPFLEGDPATALQDINSIVISESLSRKIFGEAPALGQLLRVDDRAEFNISGVFKDVPQQSSLQFDFIIPVEEYISRNDWVEDWGNNGLRLFVLLDQNASYQALNEKIKDIIRQHNESSDADVFLQPYEDMYLYGDFQEGKLAGGRIEYVRIFFVVAIFVLIIACINFMNLSTARASKRAREVGVRKAVGARQSTLFAQFMTESFLIVAVAMLLAVVMVWLVLPYFNELTEKNILLDILDPTLLLILISVLLFTALLAGSYPAVFMASLNTIKILKGNLQSGRQASLFRKGLVVFQFGISILLIVGTAIIYKQIQFIQEKNLGLDREDLVYMNLEGALVENYQALKQELIQQPGIQSVTASSQHPLSVGNSTTSVAWDDKKPDDQILFSIINADYDFVKTMEMELLNGRIFSREYSTDTVNVLINEAAARAMGMENPIGEDITIWDEYKGNVIGVVRDFHFSSMHEKIGPLIIRLDPESSFLTLVFVRTETGRTQEALAIMEEHSRQLNPAFPFEYHFVDQDFEKIYRSEMTIGSLASIFALVAIFVSCLGLLGLASYTAEQRIKEISLRKVLGASVGNLMTLLSSEFSRLVIISFVLAAPLAYYLMEQWLQGFAYRVDLTFSVFLLAGGGALMLAWLTVAYQSYRAARTNPAEVLRNE
jgi:predicted permease